MKKYFILAAAAVALMASCTKTEVVETVNDQDAITFNAFFHKATKAADVTSDNIAAFEVTAMLGTDTYFSSFAVSKNGSAWTYSPVQYWPATGTLDFFAWAPTASGSDIVKNAYNNFTITPVADPASQRDFVVARTQGAKDAASGNNATNGVTINFRHAMSQIALEVYNSNPNLQYDITGWRVVGVDGSGVYTLADAKTDGTGKIDYANWSNNTNDFGGAYTDDFDLANIKTSAAQANTAAAAISGASTMILVPQTGNDKAAKYEGSNSGDAISGSYIAIEMAIKNATDGTVVAASQWCCWPAEFTWNPGYKYTYVIDLAQGGYKNVNDGKDEKESETGKANDDLDKVLDNSAIVFAAVTVDAWDETLADINVTM